MPFVRPVTVHEVAGLVTVQLRLLGVEVTVYEAGAPPVPAATVTVAEPSPATAVGAGGAPGAVIVGLTETDEADAPDVPVALVAVAEKVYARPLVRPVTVHEVAGLVTVQVRLPGNAVTV